MKHVPEFEKPIVKLREELEDLQRKHAAKPGEKLAAQIHETGSPAEQVAARRYSNLSPWQRVQIARTPSALHAGLCKRICSDFMELHGDRHIGDDNAMPAGFATWGDTRSWWWATRRAATPRKICCATSAAPIPKATAKPCA